MDEISDRRKIILDFIIDHHGCTVAQIERALEGIMARTVIFRHIGQLKKEKIILNLSYKKNLNMLVPNLENEIAFTENCLLDFKKKYSILLAKSLKNDQIHNLSKELDFKTNDLEVKINCGKILKPLYSEFKKSQSTYNTIRSLCSDIDKDFSDSIASIKNSKQIKSSSSLLLEGKSYSTPSEILRTRIELIKSNHKKARKIKAISNTELTLKRKISEKIINKLDKIDRLEEEYLRTLKNSGYLVLTSWPVFLLLIVEHILNYRSICVWPEKIVNKDLLFELNDFVHSHLKEINLELIEFLTLSKNIRLQDEIESISKEINQYSSEDYFVKMYYDYSLLDLKDEIVSILDSISHLEKKSISYDFRHDLKLIKDSSVAILDNFSD